MQAETTTPAQSNTQARSKQVSVDLAAYPDLVVIYLGFRVRGWRSFVSLMSIGRGLQQLKRQKADGLLAHETVVFGFNHIGMRQYWRDFDSLERFTRSDPHKTWWAAFSKDTQGAGFWHEAYRRSGGIEGLYIGMPTPIGLASFAPAKQPVGSFVSSRERLAA